MDKDGDNSHENEDIFEKEDVFLCVFEERLILSYENSRKDGNKDILMEIFSSLREKRNEYAVLSGYENYYAFLLRQIPLLKYAEGIREYVREKISHNICKYDTDTSFAPSPEKSLDILSDIAKEIPLLGEFYGILKEKGKVNLADMSFTSFENGTLPEMSLHLTGELSDIETFFHELGHAYACYRNGEEDHLSGEMHAVMTEFYSYAHLGPYRERFERYHKCSTIKSIACLSAMNELNEYIYRENIPSKDIGKVYRELLREYTGTDRREYSWLYDVSFITRPGYEIYHIISSVYGMENYEKYDYQHIINRKYDELLFPESQKECGYSAEKL